MADRRAELERKKQKLAMMREEKERRLREKKAKEVAETARVISTDKDLRTEAEELLNSLGIASASDSFGPRSMGTPPNDRSISPVPDSTVFPSPTVVKPQRKVKLSVVNVHQTNIPPKESVSYNKQTQTAPSSADRDDEKEVNTPDRIF